MNERDRELGLDRAITRRDFLNGLAIGSGAVALFPWLHGCGAAPAGGPAGAVPEAPYPPALTGLRGSHEGSYEVAHALRDGTFWANAGRPRDTGERYDLVVVGGGISGLAAAYFFRAQAGPSSRILVLDNHDDFGGHARRNEFRVGDRLLLGYGGTQSIQAPSRYSRAARGLLIDVGIETERFHQAFDTNLYESLGLEPAVFFGREIFGSDHLAVGVGDKSWKDLLAGAPLSEEARRDVARVHEGRQDYLAGQSSARKKARLARLSYRDYLQKHVRVSDEALKFFQTSTHELYGVGIDAVPALDCWAIGYPGFDGLALEPGVAPGMSRTAVLDHDDEEPYIFHFPDGNASVARLLVRALVPGSVPGRTMDDIVTARMDYAKLDDPASPVRLRLESTVVRAKHLGEGASAREVEVTYARGGSLASVRAAACVLACWNGVVPHICPELPDAQKEALRYGVKVPLVYTNVAINRWTAFERLGVSDVTAPGGFHTSMGLDFPVSLGEYRCPRSPDEPMVVQMVRTPCYPGIPARDQHRVGRTELLGMTFETFERNVRDQLGRILGPGGFDPAGDISAITVNRWPHGYAYEYNSLWDPDWPAGQRPNELARRPFGRITIANSDAAAYAYTDAAIDEAHRAVGELLAPPATQ